MDRKKKLESSLEGLFSKTKGSAENKPEPEMETTPPPAAVEKEKGKKSTVSRTAKKETGEVEDKKVEETTAIPVEKSEPAAAVVEEKAKTSAPAMSWEEVLKTQAQQVQAAARSSAPVQEEKKVEPAAAAKEEKVDLALAAISDNELVIVSSEVNEGDTKLLVFEINDVAYGIDVGMVQTIIKPQAVFLVPGTVEYLKGLINLRGDVVPVIDLRTRFDLPTQETDKDTRFVVIKINDIMASMVVDKVHGVETVPLNVIEKPSGLVMDIDNRYLTGMARYNGRIVLILDLMQTIRPRTVEQR